jgi:hypothetical protein
MFAKGRLEGGEMEKFEKDATPHPTNTLLPPRPHTSAAPTCTPPNSSSQRRNIVTDGLRKAVSTAL